MGEVIHSHNYYHAAPPAPVKFPHPWILEDTRPTCTLVLGDGFVQDFLQHYGFGAVHSSCVDHQFPAPAGKLYLPTRGDRFGPDPSAFWDANKWPALFHAWEDFRKPTAREFYEKCVEAINPTVKQGLWSFDTASLGYQLRAYLWHYFVSFDRSFLGELAKRKANTLDWPWARLIALLDTDFRLSIVSFNYDLVVEHLFAFHRRPLLRNPAYGVPLEQHSKGTIFSIHPHGCIDEFITHPFGEGPPNPWLGRRARFVSPIAVMEPGMIGVMKPLLGGENGHPGGVKNVRICECWQAWICW